MFTTTSRKVLVPFATLVAAGAVAVGSGATFTSTSDSSISATSGTLVHANSEDAATLTITNLKPGATESGTLTITNVGSLDSTIKVIASGATGALADKLQLKIESSDTGTAFDSGFETADDNTAGFDLGALTAGQTVEDFVTVTITVRMEGDADNTYQNTTAGLSLQFITTQTDATSDESDSNWQ